MLYGRLRIQEGGEAWINATRGVSGNVDSYMLSSKKELGNHRWQAVRVL